MSRIQHVRCATKTITTRSQCAKARMKIIHAGYTKFIQNVRMPQSHCAESTPEQGQIDHLSLFGGSLLVILVHSGNENDNDNRFEQCSSHASCFVD